MLDVHPPIQLDLYQQTKDKFCFVNRKWLQQKRSKLNRSAESDKSNSPERKDTKQDSREERQRVFLTVGESPRNSYYKPTQLKAVTTKYADRVTPKPSKNYSTGIDFLKTHMSNLQSSDNHLKRVHVKGSYKNHSNRSSSNRKDRINASDTIANTRLNTEAFTHHEAMPSKHKTDRSEDHTALLLQTPVKLRPKLVIKSKATSPQITKYNASASKLDLPEINVSASHKKPDPTLTPMQKAIKKIAQSPKLSSNWFYLKDNN